MIMRMKYIISCLSILAGICSFQFSQAQTLDEIWKQKFADANSILETYAKGKAAAPSRKSAEAIYNDCYMVYQSGEYLVWTHGKKTDYGKLVEVMPRIDLNNEHVRTFMETHDGPTLVDHIFMFKALKKGEDIETARDGISFTTLFMNVKVPNHNDYDKLKTVFSGNNDKLQQAYLKKLDFVFQNHGLTDGLLKIRPLIEKNVQETPLKKTVLDLFDSYLSLCEGEITPNAAFTDEKGEKYTFADFKGKVIVVDVWATWCCSCLEKMPYYQSLREEYQDNEDVIFLTVSIDQPKAYEKWKKTLSDNKMSGTLNLLPDRESSIHFESAFHIVGVPRYMVIGKDGRNVNLYAPSPNSGLKLFIEKSLKH